MATFIALVNFTEQGLHKVKDSPKRAKAFGEMAKKLGVTVKDIYWTQGQYDLVVTMEANNEATVSALMLSISALGNVRGQTLRAFSREEFEKILEKLP